MRKLAVSFRILATPDFSPPPNHASEAWTAKTLSGASSQTLAGGDIAQGDLGVSGQSIVSATLVTELDGKEALRFNLDQEATEVTVNLSRFYINDDGGLFVESGLLRLRDSDGNVVGEKAFRAGNAAGTQQVSLAAADGFVSVELLAGAYNGDTLLELAAVHPVERAYLFEPDAENFAALQKNLGSRDIRVHCLPLALSDAYRILTFTAGAGEAGRISTNGTVHIAAMALDDLLCNQSTDFIKLDVEGGEIAALNGAAKLIRRCRPVLAISFYHRPQDLWEIPQLLRDLCPDYQFFLRQHYFNSFDSVFYAVPR